MPLECYNWLVPRGQWVQTPHLAEKDLEGGEPSPHWNASSRMRFITPPASPAHLDVKHAPLDVFLSPSPSQLPVRASPCYGGRAVTAPVLGSASVGLRLLSLRPCTVAKLWWTRNSNRASLRFLFRLHHVDAAHWFLGGHVPTGTQAFPPFVPTSSTPAHRAQLKPARREQRGEAGSPPSTQLLRLAADAPSPSKPRLSCPVLPASSPSADTLL